MTAPRAFTTLLTEAIKKVTQPARANQWLERLSVPRGFSKQEMDTFLAPRLREQVEAGNPTLSPDDLVRILEERGAVSKLAPMTNRESPYDRSQRLDLRPEANYREQLPYLQTESPVKIGPHTAFPRNLDGDILPSWARMEDVVTETGAREPMVAQVQSDRRRLSQRARSAKPLNPVQQRDIKDYYSPEAWDASNGDANYRPAIALAIRDAIDSGHSRVLFPTGESLEASSAMTRADGDQTYKGVYDEINRVVRGAGVEPEWEQVGIRVRPATGDFRGPDALEYIDDFSTSDLEATLLDSGLDDAGRKFIGEEIALRKRLMGMTELERNQFADANIGLDRSVEWANIEARLFSEGRQAPGTSILSLDDVPMTVPALRLDKLKDKPLPILTAAIMAGAGVAAAPGMAEAQDPESDARLREAILAAQRGAQTGEEEDGLDFPMIGSVVAAIGAAALGGRALMRRLAQNGVPPLPAPIPSTGLTRQMTTNAPATNPPATPQNAAALAQHTAERQRAIARLRQLAEPLEASVEIPRKVQDIIDNGPSHVRQMRNVDQEIADLQESLVTHGYVQGSGRVRDVDWIRTAEEVKARAGGKEFWLDNPDEVFADPRLTAAAIAAHENAATSVQFSKLAVDPTQPPEMQQYAARMSNEFMTRAIGAQQRVARDASEVGRTLRSIRLLQGIFKGNINNGQAWMQAAINLAGKDLQTADAMAIAHLVATGRQMEAAVRLNKLRKAHWLDKVDEGLRSAMQLTFLRPIRDLLGNSINAADFALAGQFARIADMGLSIVTGEREVMPANIARQIGLMTKGGVTGGVDAMRLLLRMDTKDDIEFMRRVAERMDFTNETTFTSPLGNWLGTQARRWFTAADYPTYRAAVNDVLADLSMVSAYKAGHRGANLGRAARQIFENPGPVLEVKAQAEAIERVWQQRTPLSTATHAWMSNTTPMNRFMVRRVMPFVHTTTAQIGQAVDQSPVGVIKTASQFVDLVKAVINKMPTGEAQRKVARHLGLHATGAGWMYLGWYLENEGIIQGAYQGDETRENAAMEQKNIRPMSIKMDGKWYAISMLLGPQAMLMAMGAGLNRGLRALAEMEAQDPDMEMRWQDALAHRMKQVGTTAFPVAREFSGVMRDLPLGQGVDNIMEIGGALQSGNTGSRLGNLAGRIASQPIPTAVQQMAELGDLDETGQVVRRDTRGEDFIEGMSATLNEAIPGRRNTLPVRVKPFGDEGKGIDVGESPYASLINPGRNRYREQEDWVTDELMALDAFPTPVRRRNGESVAEFNDRRRVEGQEEYVALYNALNGQMKHGLEYADQKALKRLVEARRANPEGDHSALISEVLRSVSSGIRSERTRKQNEAARARQ